MSPDPESFYLPGEPYSRQMRLIQGVPASSWSLISGPPGLTINSQNGRLGGWTPGPADVGNLYAVTVRATNANGSDDESWTVQVLPGATSDNVDTPWGTIHGNLARTQSSNAPSLRFSEAWQKGARVAWALSTPDRPVGLSSMAFDESGNIYWQADYAVDGKAAICSASPDGTLRWIGHAAANEALGWGDATGPVVGDGGQAGRVYSLGYDYTPAADPSNGFVVAYKKSTGLRVWRTELPDAYFKGDGNRRDKVAPVLYQGKLYILGRPYGADPGPYNAMFYCVNSETGAIEWSNELTGAIDYNPLYGSGAGQAAFVPDALGTGVHGFYFNLGGWDADDARAEMYCVAVNASGNTAALAWKDQGGKAVRGHVLYLADQKRVFMTSWGEYGFSLYGWNLDGTYKSTTVGAGGGAHGYFDLACLDFNGKDILAGSSDGRLARYAGITRGSPPGTPVVIYDSGGFETFALGDANGQDGWTGESDPAGGTPPQVVDASGGNPVQGTKSIRLEVPDASGAKSILTLPIDDLVAAGYKLITVSFDIYRASADSPLENLWWYWFDTGSPTYGLQWDIGGTRPFGFEAGAGEATTIKDRWVTIVQEWNLEENVAKSWYDGVAVDSAFPISGILTLTGWGIALQHDAGTGTGPEVAWIDNFFITASTDPGASGGPKSSGFYQLDPAFGELQPQGGLYQDRAGDSIIVTGTVGWPAPVPGKVIAANVSKAPLISDCTTADDAPLLIDDFRISGDVSGDIVKESFDGLTQGNLAGQASAGLDSAGWQDDNSGAGGGGTPTQVIADPTGAGRGNVVSIDALQSCGGTKGIAALLATPLFGEVVTVSWWQYRGDLTDNVWYDTREGSAGWYALQRDADGKVIARGNHPLGGETWVGPLTAGAWQKVEYKFDFVSSAVVLTVSDGSGVLFTHTDFLDPFAELAVNGWAWRVEATALSSSPRTSTIFTYEIGYESGVARGIAAGPALGPVPSGARQQIYYFETGNYAKRLVALTPACGTPASDVDGDTDVDLADFGVFQSCFNGPNRPWPAAGQPGDCACLDADGDGDVDLSDFGVFQTCFNGPNRPPACQ